MKLPDNTGLVLFDLDGTLVDSVPDLAWCGDAMMRELGLPERGVGAARAWVGNGIERFVKRVLSASMHDEPDSALFESAIDIFKRYYRDNSFGRSAVYPGVVECLEALTDTDVHVACVTNKAGEFTEKVLVGLGLRGYFELVVAGDTTPEKKPHPLPLLHAAGHFSLPPERCLLIGDSSNDVKAARAAGFSVYCVPYGYNHGEDIHLAEPDRVIETMLELTG